MIDNRLARITRILRDSGRGESEIQRFCSAGVEILGVEGVTICLVTNNVLGAQSSSAIEFALLDEEQFALGDGPTFDAATAFDPIWGKHLQTSHNKKRWPLFSHFAESKGIYAALAFPLRVGDSHLGVLTAYRTQDDPISTDALADGVTLAAMVSSFVISQLAGKSALDIDEAFGAISRDQSLVHFASGIVAEQLNISIVEAMVRIRAYAYASGLPLDVISSRIANHTLTIDELN